MHLVEEEYAQRACPVSSLRAILEGYPLSAGIFRELLQNSDDAGASKQVWLINLDLSDSQIFRFLF
jgi:sacsin